MICSTLLQEDFLRKMHDVFFDISLLNISASRHHTTACSTQQCHHNYCLTGTKLFPTISKQRCTLSLIREKIFLPWREVSCFLILLSSWVQTVVFYTAGASPDKYGVCHIFQNNPQFLKSMQRYIWFVAVYLKELFSWPPSDANICFFDKHLITKIKLICV